MTIERTRPISEIWNNIQTETTARNQAEGIRRDFWQAFTALDILLADWHDEGSPDEDGAYLKAARNVLRLRAANWRRHVQEHDTRLAYLQIELEKAERALR